MDPPNAAGILTAGVEPQIKVPWPCHVAGKSRQPPIEGLRYLSVIEAETKAYIDDPNATLLRRSLGHGERCRSLRATAEALRDESRLASRGLRKMY